MVLGVTTTDPIADVILGAGFALTLYLALRNGHKTDKAADKVSDKVVEATAKVDVVHALVNSQLDRAIDRKDVAEKRTAVLEKERDQPNG
jgi:hypothetical protein